MTDRWPNPPPSDITSLILFHPADWLTKFMVTKSPAPFLPTQCKQRFFQWRAVKTIPEAFIGMEISIANRNNILARFLIRK